jgi:hypothetical protein
MFLIMIKLHILQSLLLNIIIVDEKNVILPRALTGNKLGHFYNIYFFKKCEFRRLVTYAKNISSYSKHYRKHAIIKSEVTANVLNRFRLSL